MWLLNTQSEKLEEWNEHDEELQYATLSHTWLRRSEGEGQEVLFADMADLATARQKAGWNKLDFAMKRAASDELRYVWIDTCCIDKESSAELAEAINSMFRIYQKSKYCYVYLDGHMQDETQSAAAHSDIDVSSAPIVCSANISAIPHQEEHSSEHGILMDEHNPPLNSADLPYSSEPGSGSSSRGNESGLRSGVSNAIFFCVAPAPICNITALFQKCRWFTRGWTLQEMVASPNVLFYDASGKYIGTLAELVEKVSIITGVHREMLSRRRPLSSFSIAQRMAWASTRQTTRVEDRAYSMLGIFDVNLPILYGEGVRAFQRLQEELLRVYNDHTIFAWGYASPGFDVGNRCDLLASSPDEFNHDQYTKITAVTGTSDQKQYEVLGRTIRFHLPVLHMSKKDRFQAGVRYTAVLDCCFEDHPMRRICMELECAVSGDLVRLCGVTSRDAYSAVTCSTSHSFTVQRKADDTNKGRGKETWQSTGSFENLCIRCTTKRWRPYSPDPYIESGHGRVVTNPEWAIDPFHTAVSHASTWNHEAKMFELPLSIRVPFQHHVDRSASIAPFYHDGYVEIQFPRTSLPAIQVKIRIFPRLTYGGQVVFAKGAPVTIQVGSRTKHAPSSGEALIFHLKGGRALVAEVCTRKILSQEFWLIEFHAYGRGSIAWLYFRRLCSTTIFCVKKFPLPAFPHLSCLCCWR